MSTELQYTPGPWRWELNEASMSLQLVGGEPEYDLTIIEPTRWGMHSSTLLIRDTAHDGMNIMHKLHERRDWIAPFPGRAHHARWCASVTHPDMRLIAAAPDLLEAIQAVLQMDVKGRQLQDRLQFSDLGRAIFEKARAAIAKATGKEATHA